MSHWLWEEGVSLEPMAEGSEREMRGSVIAAVVTCLFSSIMTWTAGVVFAPQESWEQTVASRLRDNQPHSP